MDLLLIFLICFGLTFDVFGIAVSQGSVLGCVKARNTMLMCLLVGGWQVVSMALGYGLVHLPFIPKFGEEAHMAWTIVSATIFIAAGGIKIFLLHSKKNMPEERSEVDFKKICGIAASTSVYTLFVGMGCGILLLSATVIGIVIFAMTVVLVIAGVFVGYRNGELDKHVYLSGGIFLVIAGILIIIQYFNWYVTRG